MHIRSFVVTMLAGLAVLLSVPGNARAQGAITNGENHTGTIAVSGGIDQWTFSANQGDSIVLNLGEVLRVPDSGFSPWIRLYGPTGAQIGGDSFYGALVAQIATVAPLTGTYTVRVAAGYPGYTAVGDYRLILARVPGQPVVPGGDQGGPMTNGVNHVGRIELGDLDQWTFTANQGESLVVEIGEIAVGSGVPDPNFYPWIRLYGPTGVQIGGDSFYGAAVAQVATTAPLTGTYTVLVAAGYPNYAAAGDYRLVLAQVPGTPVVDEGDHGGRLANGVNHDGRIEVGDLDQWTFTANQGESLVVSVGERVVGPGVPDPGFYPWIRLYGPTGAQIGGDSFYGALVAQAVTVAPLTGTYTVLVSAGYPNYAAAGDYRLILAQMPSRPVIETDDDNDHDGPMANGVNHVGRDRTRGPGPVDLHGQSRREPGRGDRRNRRRFGRARSELLPVDSPLRPDWCPDRRRQFLRCGRGASGHHGAAHRHLYGARGGRLPELRGRRRLSPRAGADAGRPGRGRRRPRWTDDQRRQSRRPH